MSPNYLPSPGDREDARLREVGVTKFIPEISGARSIVETMGDALNAQKVIDNHLAAGYRGCWIIALGTNDSANQVVGGNVPYDKRIALVMDKLKDQPSVMWLTVRTLKTTGPYAEKYQQQWNSALLDATKVYPNLRLFDWASEAQDEWYVKDGIHFTTPGYQQRAQRIARALAIAFPVGKPAIDQTVVSSR